MSEEHKSNDEPYLGRDALLHFDKMIARGSAQNAAVFDWSRQNGLSFGDMSPRQKAGGQIIPYGFSIALSIRALIRVGHLLSAEILLRPLIENAGVISYLIEVGEEAVAHWEKGWSYDSRPQLKQLIAAMKGDLGEGNTFEKEAAFVKHFNRLVHADPAGSRRNTGHSPNGLFGFLAGANIGSPKLCDYICIWAAFCLGVLYRRASQLFPDAGFDGDVETVREFASFLVAQKPE